MTQHRCAHPVLKSGDLTGSRGSNEGLTYTQDICSDVELVVIDQKGIRDITLQITIQGINSVYLVDNFRRLACHISGRSTFLLCN
jgi:hypothetical protein